VVRRRLTRLQTIARVKGKWIDNETHVGGVVEMERACTWILLLMMRVRRMYKGRHEGSHKVDNRLANYQRDEGHGAAQRLFWLGRMLFGLGPRPVVRASGSLPRGHS